MACRNKERADMAKKELTVKYPKMLGQIITDGIVDVGDPKSRDAFVEWVGKNFSGIDIHVNNAGISINPKKNNE
jgi:short-subunit dehydrogenase involved in D-alanine esterification of teichoic acids